VNATTSPDASRKATTYLPSDTSREEIVDFARTLREIEEHVLRRSGLYAELVAPDGGRRAIPAEVFRALEQVVDALANGKGVTVAPYSTLLTTQEAADFLGVSRPTLVKLLDGGEMEFEKRNRHRKVTLRALVDYQERSRQERRAALSDFVKAGQEIDSYYRPDSGGSEPEES
jgi:excisionase family DNA binding protein